TPAMQAVAKANDRGKTIHVFGLVADPFTAGVGLRRDAPLDHPRHLVGTGIPLPVAESFRLARKFFPALKGVAVVWNPAESNSVTFVTQARAVARELEIELLEAHVDNSSGVFEAASSLVARGAQTLWIPGDNTVQTAVNSILTAAKKGRIPVFSIVPPPLRAVAPSLAWDGFFGGGGGYRGTGGLISAGPPPPPLYR